VLIAWQNLHVLFSKIDLFHVESTWAMAAMARNANHAKAVAGRVQISELNKNDQLHAESQWGMAVNTYAKNVFSRSR
jgi:hypothetical protein